MDDFQPVLTGARRAVATQTRTHRELCHLRGPEMEETQHQRGAGIIAQRNAQHGAITETALHRLDATFDLRRHTGLQGTDGQQRGAVFVAQRQVQPQILQRGQSTRFQLGGHPRPHARQMTEGFGRQIEGNGITAGRHATRMPSWAQNRNPDARRRRGFLSPDCGGSLTSSSCERIARSFNGCPHSRRRRGFLSPDCGGSLRLGGFGLLRKACPHPNPSPVNGRGALSGIV
ncbi:hypothetical protein D3C81_1109290 [compost metagenome]